MRPTTVQNFFGTANAIISYRLEITTINGGLSASSTVGLLQRPRTRSHPVCCQRRAAQYLEWRRKGGRRADCCPAGDARVADTTHPSRRRSGGPDTVASFSDKLGAWHRGLSGF